MLLFSVVALAISHYVQKCILIVCVFIIFYICQTNMNHEPLKSQRSSYALVDV
ncbi:hypothetical protein HanOQP8_Chr05g0175631 [Helianthus annuus]|nr:hypothetical protein HanIR_Chr05g0215431 [Helianthus annuus]KAJ0746270.1 hypothetical protein HanOQP8_Chr05g0175631 [Helianthus annuus]